MAASGLSLKPLELPSPLIFLLLVPQRQFGSWLCRNPACVEVEESVAGPGPVGKHLCRGELACSFSLWRLAVWGVDLLRDPHDSQRPWTVRILGAKPDSSI